MRRDEQTFMRGYFLLVNVVKNLVLTIYSKEDEMPSPVQNSVLGGPFNGYSPKQTINNFKSGDEVMARSILRNSWNTAYATGSYNNLGRVITPFRAVNNSGDFLGRVAYTCGGPNQVNASKPGWKGRIGSIINNCDTTNVPASSCNVRFVADSSDYVTFKRQQAINQNYNDFSNGGDESNASYVPWMRVRV